MKALTFRLRLLQPVLATQVGAGEENSSTAQQYIPGSALRGAVIREYLHQHPQEDIAESEDGRKLFFGGKVCYLNAYLADASGKRMLPTPYSWRVPKNGETNPVIQIVDFAIAPQVDLPNPKRPSGEYVVINDQGVVNLQSPKRFIQVHNGSDQRMTKQAGQSFVFRYDALAKDQTFIGTIISQDQASLEAIKTLLDSKIIMLGGSLGAEYGQVQVEAVQLLASWQEVTNASAPADDIVTITLLSDAIIRGEDGQYHLDLAPVLGKVHPLRAFTNHRIVGGFNKKWGLPLPQSIAIQAGSVFVYSASAVKPELRASLEENGIGERKIEGFGRIAVNWTGFSHLTSSLEDNRSGADSNHSITDSQVSPSLAAESREIALRILERRLRVILESNLSKAVSEGALRGAISNAQLSRLRLVARQVGQQKQYQPMLDHLNNLRSGKKQLERTYIGNISLMDWLNDMNEIWAKYLAPLEHELPQLAGLNAEIRPEIKIEYVARLIEALLRKASRDNQGGR